MGTMRVNGNIVCKRARLSGAVPSTLCAAL